MRLDQDLRHDDLVLEIRALASVGRVLVAADVVPGPAVEAAVLYGGQVIGRKIGTDMVAFVPRAPESTGAWLDGHTGAVAQAGRIVADGLAFRIEHAHHGPVLFLAPGRTNPVGLLIGPNFLPGFFRHFGGNIGSRADRDEQAFAVAGNFQVARPMARRGNISDYDFGWPGGLAVAAAIGIANDLVRGAHIDVFGRSRRMERDAVGTFQVVGEDFGRRLAVFGCVAGEDQDASGLSFRHEDIAIRCNPHDARLFQTTGEHLHRETL